MKSVITVLYIEIVNSAVERPSNLQCAHKEMNQLGNIVRNLEGLIPMHFGGYQTSSFVTERFHAMCHI